MRFLVALLTLLPLPGYGQDAGKENPADGGGKVKTVDLLAVIDPSRDSVGGPWKILEGALLSPEGVAVPCLQIPFVPPAEYDLTVVAESLNQSSDLHVGLIYGKRQFYLNMDGWSSSVCGLALIDGKNSNANETTFRGRCFTPNRAGTVVCSVRRTGVRVRFDETTIIDWKGDPGRVSMDPASVRPPRHDVLFIRTFNSVMRFSKLSLSCRIALESEPPPGQKPSSWARAAGDLPKLVDAGEAERLARAAREVASFDSAESAGKLMGAFLQGIRQVEALEAQDQRAIRAMDDETERLVGAYLAFLVKPQGPAAAEFYRCQQRYLGLMKAEETLADRVSARDRMLEDLLEVLALLRTKEAVQGIQKQAQASINPRYRARLIETLGRVRTPTAVAALVEILRKGAREVESLAAARALRAIGVPTPEAVSALEGALASGYRQVRLTAAMGLAEMGCREKTEALVECLKGTSGQFAMDLNEALKTLTGADKRGKYDSWKEWWDRNRESVLDGTYRAEGPDRAGEAGSTTTFYGIPVYSTAVAFLIDVSASMFEPAEWIPLQDDEGKNLGLGLAGNLKVHVAQYELKKVLLRLPEDSTVVLIFFDGTVRVQAGGPIRLTGARRKSLVDLVDGIKTPGGLTNLWGAVMRALSYAGDSEAPSLVKDGIDTIYAMTDGIPTVGLSETDRFLKRFNTLNRYPQVRVHAVQVTTQKTFQRLTGVDPGNPRALLEALARESGGLFQQR